MRHNTYPHQSLQFNWCGTSDASLPICIYAIWQNLLEVLQLVQICVSQPLYVHPESSFTARIRRRRRSRHNNVQYGRHECEHQLGHCTRLGRYNAAVAAKHCAHTTWQSYSRNNCACIQRCCLKSVQQHHSSICQRSLDGTVRHMQAGKAGKAVAAGSKRPLRMSKGVQRSCQKQTTCSCSYAAVCIRMPAIWRRQCKALRESHFAKHNAALLVMTCCYLKDPHTLAHFKLDTNPKTVSARIKCCKSRIKCSAHAASHLSNAARIQPWTHEITLSKRQPK
jgi:hypothetical protein